MNEALYDIYQSYTGEPKTCEQFGCGKKLTRGEELAGDKCTNHSVNQTVRKEDLIIIIADLVEKKEEMIERLWQAAKGNDSFLQFLYVKEVEAYNYAIKKLKGLVR